MAVLKGGAYRSDRVDEVFPLQKEVLRTLSYGDVLVAAMAVDGKMPSRR